MSLVSLLDNKQDHLYLLDCYDKKTLVLWACHCAEHVLVNFENISSDERPRNGLQICYAWIKGESTVHQCRLAALATHAAARDVIKNDAACFAARAVGQAISTPHVAAHAIAASGYARKSIFATGGNVEAEYTWQMEELKRLSTKESDFTISIKNRMNHTEIASGTIHELPADLEQTLVSHPDVLEKRNILTALARNEWICWITIVKKPETRQAHIDRLCEDLLNDKKRPCCWPGCPHHRASAKKWFPGMKDA